MAKPNPVEIVCTFDHYPLNAKQTKAIADAIRKTAKDVCPGIQIRGLWVHEKVG